MRITTSIILLSIIPNRNKSSHSPFYEATHIKPNVDNWTFRFWKMMIIYQLNLNENRRGKTFPFLLASLRASYALRCWCNLFVYSFYSLSLPCFPDGIERNILHFSFLPSVHFHTFSIVLHLLFFGTFVICLSVEFYYQSTNCFEFNLCFIFMHCLLMTIIFFITLPKCMKCSQWLLQWHFYFHSSAISVARLRYVTFYKTFKVVERFKLSDFSWRSVCYFFLSCFHFALS